MQYLGGKSRIAKYVGPYLNDLRAVMELSEGRIVPYWEPFIGAGWIMSRIDHGPAWGSDYHAGLISIWQALQEGWRPPEHVSEEDYYKAKEGPPGPDRAFIGFAVSFTGKWWGGFARGRVYASSSGNSLLKKFKAMPKPITFYQADFFKAEPPRPRMLIYCDPPYAGSVRYPGTPKWKPAKFWRRVIELEEEGHTVIVSEYEAPPGFSCIWHKPVKLDVRSGEGENLPRVERLFRYGDHIPIRKGYK